jgi:predicted aldo/keto reductase-like oxidoreductase
MEVGHAASDGTRPVEAGKACSPEKQAGERRALGRTELKVFPLGLGAGGIKEAAVARRALDLGVNYFDTAEGYQDGNSEITLGKGLKGRREEAVIATKWGRWGKKTADDYVAACEESLKRLDTDFVDIIQFHCAETKEHVAAAHEIAWEAFSRLKDAGKARFNGISAHENQVEVVEAVIESGRFDQMLLVYNAANAAQTGPAIRKAREAGSGVVAMKALAPVHEAKKAEEPVELPEDAYRKAMQWVIADENVSTLIVNMPTFEQLEEGVAAARGTLSPAEKKSYEDAVTQASLGMCHMCGACTGQCVQGVRVAEVMRHRLYHDGYGDRARAVALYRALPRETDAAACSDCAACPVVCPWGVPVQERMMDVHRRLA